MQEVEDSLVTALEEAISKGNVDQARDMAEVLARKKAKLCINLISVGDDGSSNTFKLDVKLESTLQDNVPFAPIPLQVSSGMSIFGLKVKMAILHNIPMRCQNWIIGKKIARDKEILSNLRITKPCKVYLFVVEPKTLELDRGEASRQFEMLKKFHDSLVQRGLNPDLAMTEDEYSNYLRQSFGGQRYRPMGQPGVDAWSSSYTQLDSAVGNEGIPTYTAGDVPDSPGTLRNPNGHQGQHATGYEYDIIALSMPGSMSARGHTGPPKPPAPPKRIPKPLAREVGWSCERCTFVNPPIIPACRTCLAPRPENYEIPLPDSYIMDKDEERIFLEMKQNEMLLEEWEEEEKQEGRRQASQNLAQMMQVAEQDLVTNMESFECPICFTEVEPNEGVTLRECLHQFCRECLEHHINICNEPEIKCPYTDGDDCEQVIPDREIKQIISEEDYKRYLHLSVNRAEAAAPDSFHCKSPDCVGLCFYDDEINFFDCEVCGHQNCLTCKAIHEGQNCKTYQEDLRIKAGNDVAAKKTHEALQEMVRKGEAMNCPKCGVVIQKKSGCDWMQCSMCKVEICWVTKGARWGPKGRGDTTGGCKCRVNGKCHPNCGNCH
ncbi:ranBP-type and C3HC4-type zinc finger-containing protein 1-like [Apostichopus japonicus]|uniref:ranBP-type and C3HC4-type zinc finger-containing protein 1-like n=1 Tax=Stichopus japonicus TaxID=307972 RepID=UPI003AB494DE